ncbi:MAG: hypothetical protein HY243_12000 [Proteobacteria bacterium]|nr:hypothetical protein [Pseudomonadota bacterium]
MKCVSFAALCGLGLVAATPALAACDTSRDVVIAARTPQVDLYDAADGKRVLTMDKDKFPACTPIQDRASNLMLKVTVNGTAYWVPPHMVNYHFNGKTAAVCRNLALGSNEARTGATRGLGEGCPKPKAPSP